MKIAIPVADQNLCRHFGHCQQFYIYEVDETNKAILSETKLVPPPHEPGLLPRWLQEKGVHVIIAGGMGNRAQHLFTERNIKAVVGAPLASPKELVSQYLNGTLVTGENACDH